jgi:hypothetical protein
LPRAKVSSIQAGCCLSIRMTSAPKSDRIMPAKGAGARPASSRTRIPFSGGSLGPFEDIASPRDARRVAGRAIKPRRPNRRVKFIAEFILARLIVLGSSFNHLINDVTLVDYSGDAAVRLSTSLTAYHCKLLKDGTGSSIAFQLIGSVRLVEGLVSIRGRRRLSDTVSASELPTSLGRRSLVRRRNLARAPAKAHR